MKTPKGFWKVFGIAFAIVCVVQIATIVWWITTGSIDSVPVSPPVFYPAGYALYIVFIFAGLLFLAISNVAQFGLEAIGPLFIVLFLINAGIWTGIVTGICYLVKRLRTSQTSP